MNDKLKERIAKIPKSNKVWIHNEILGLTTPEILNDAIRIGAIVKRNDRYFVATEKKILADDTRRGKVLKEYSVVSTKWYEFKNKYNSDYLKCEFKNRQNLTLFD